MLKEINDLRTQKGSLMIEALAMLGLISMVTPVIYKKAAERTTEMQDINAASQVRVIVKGIDDYLRDNYTRITAGDTIESNISGISQSYSAFNTPDTDTDAQTVTVNDIKHFSDYLPLGFQPDGKLFKDFKVAIKQTKDPSGERKALTAVLVAKTDKSGKVDPSFTRMRSARIASMIGTNGGYVDEDKATGVQGVWQIEKDKLPDKNVDSGTIVATSIEAVADGTAGGKNVLHRVLTPGREIYNTMETTLHMGGQNIDQLTNLIAAGDKITITKRQPDETTSANVNLVVEGETNIEDTLRAAGRNFVVNTESMFHKNKLFLGEDQAACYSSDDPSCSAPFFASGDDGRMVAASGDFKVSKEGNTTMSGYADIGDYANIAGYLNALDSNFTVANKDSKPTLTFAKDVIVADKDKFQVMNNKFYVKNEGTADFFDGMLNINGKDTDDPLLNNRVTVGTNLDVYGFVNIDNNAEVQGSLSASNGGNGFNFISNSNTVRAGKITGSDLYGFNVAAETGNTTFESNVVANINGEKIFDINDTTEGYTTSKKLQAGYGNQTNFSGYNFDVNDSDSDSVKIAATYNDLRTRSGWKSHNLIVGNALATLEGELKIGKKQIGEKYTYAATFQDNKIDTQTNEFNINSGIGDSLIKIDGNITPTNDGSAPIYIRRGVIEIARNDDKDNPSGYIKADRLLSNIEQDSAADGTLGIYDYEVNPAYTSMMHDIKLSSRGGARLSDILPDFINKGIYVMDNTYYVLEGKTGNWVTNSISYKTNKGFMLNDLEECGDANTACDTSPWLGFIPTPNCPPGYMKVATITPIRFAMAQAGVPDILKNDNEISGLNVPEDKKGEYRVIRSRKDPRGDNIKTNETGKYEKTSATTIHVFDNGGNLNIKTGDDLVSPTPPPYWAEVHNAPYTFQVSTWLNTTIKAYYTDAANKEGFKGWHGIMGFIYPAKDYEEYAQAIGIDISKVDNNTIFWNLFPVFKEELSAIATVYCYFDRSSSSFDEKYVDKYMAHNQTELSKIRDKEKDSGDASATRLNDTTLNYGNDAYW